MPATITGDQTGTVGLVNTTTAKNSTSGTTVDFTGIPSGVRRIIIIFNGVSTNGAGTSNFVTRIGSGSVTSSGYTAYAGTYTGTNITVTTSNTTGFLLTGAQGNSSIIFGHQILTLVSGNTWVSSHNFGGLDGSSTVIIRNGGGVSPALSGALDRVQITTLNGTDAFDAGSINILYD